MKNTKYILIDNDYKVRFKLDCHCCTATLLISVTYLWGLLTIFKSTYNCSYFKFTPHSTKHNEWGEAVVFGHVNLGTRWLYQDIAQFSFKSHAHHLFDKYSLSMHQLRIRESEQKQINKLFESCANIEPNFISQA